ncbi:MAG: TetR/AcrR family transcriptional regulator [Anaerolineae bacterium]
MTEDIGAGDVISRWERRKEETRRRLLTEGERHFRLQGFDATTVEEIAVAADVAKGTFFNYFDSKEALLGELLHMRLQSLLEAPRGDGAQVRARIWQLLQDVHHELEPYVHLFQRMFAYALSHPALESLPKHHPTLAQALAALVRDGQAEGRFDPAMDADVAGTMIATYFFRICVLESVHEPDAEFCWEYQMSSALDLLYSGLQRRKSAPDH